VACLGERGKAGIPGSLRAAEGAVHPRNEACRLASRSSFDVDQIYWKVLYKEGMGEAMLDTATLAGKEEFLNGRRISLRRIGQRSRMMRALISKDVMKSWELWYNSVSHIVAISS